MVRGLKWVIQCFGHIYFSKYLFYVVYFNKDEKKISIYICVRKKSYWAENTTNISNNE